LGNWSRRRLAGLLIGFLVLLHPAAHATQLSDSDLRAYREAFGAAKEGNFQAALRAGSHARDQLLMTVLQWLALTRTGEAGFSEIAAFATAHPDWPGQQQLRRRAEEAMAGVSDATAAEWFAAHPPVTATGKLRQADLWLARGRREAAQDLIRQVWTDADFNRDDEKTILQKYHTFLRPADHVARLDRLLWDGQADAAKRMYRLVEPDYRALAEARLALAAQEPGAERLIGRVSAALQRDSGLIYERVRWRRRKEHYEDAIALLDAAPKDTRRPEAWAVEREVLARYALAEGKPVIAYHIASQHGLVSGAHFSELEFFAGWIALRSLNQPKAAYGHFVQLHDTVRLPISVARGAYWSARAAEAMGQRTLAEGWYAKAAELITTYYGQLAIAHRGVADTAAVIAEPRPRPDEIAAFNGRDLVKVTRGLAEVGADDFIRPFMRQLSETAATPGAHVLVARLATELLRPELAVASAKLASYAGVNLLVEGYPLQEMPPGNSVERPLLLAVTRQESAFDRDAVSRSGARGLMQLMPGTAKEVAKSMGMAFSLPRLTGDPRYNLLLGREYLAGMLDDFSGSYVLAVAAYNAGPARVRQWMRDFGDPRTKRVDVVDWIESIPVAETRNYLQRVLENLQIYRWRVGDRDLAFSLTSDLKR
jgi:soluble lytic murein transglycosylase